MKKIKEKIIKKKCSDEEEMKQYAEREEKYNDKLRDEAQKQKFLNRMNNIKINTYTKKMVSIIITVCIVDIQLSYILAFFNKSNTVESLSTQLCITILGVAFVYMIRAYFDSRAEHKNLDNNIKDEIINNINDKITNVFNSAGIDTDESQLINKDDLNDSDNGFHINNKHDN